AYRRFDRGQSRPVFRAVLPTHSESKQIDLRRSTYLVLADGAESVDAREACACSFWRTSRLCCKSRPNSAGQGKGKAVKGDVFANADARFRPRTCEGAAVVLGRLRVHVQGRHGGRLPAAL